jgi:hypothetical protein
MNVSAVPPAQPGDSQRRVQASHGSQTGGQDPLSKFAALLDTTGPIPTWTSLAEVAQPIEHVPAPASREDMRPFDFAPLPALKETHDNPTETAASHSGPLPVGDADRPASRRSRGSRPKAIALASLFLIGMAVVFVWRDHVHKLAETCRSMLLDAIAGLDDAPTPRANVMPERAAQPPREDTLFRATPVAGNVHSRRVRPDNSEEQSVNASAPAGTGALAPVATAPADVGVRPRGTTAVESATPSATSAVPVRDYAQSARPWAKSYEEQAVDASPAAIVAPAPGAASPAGMSARPSGTAAVKSATPSTANAVPVTDGALSTHPRAESHEEQAVHASPPAGTVAPGANAPADVSAPPSDKTAAESATPNTARAVPVTEDAQSAHLAAETSEEEQAVDASPSTGTVARASAPNAPADAGAAEMPLAPRPAIAPVRVGSRIPEPSPVRTISVRPDGTLISSSIGSSNTSSAADALTPTAKRVSEGADGSAGTAPASNPSSGLPNTLGGKPGIAAAPNDVAQMPTRLSQPGNRHKREKSGKSANALKVNAAETDANASTIQSESSGSDQAPANTPTIAHAGRL